LTREELAELVAQAGQPAFRAGQLAEWVFQRRAPDIASMSNLPAALRTSLAQHFATRTMTIAGVTGSRDTTRKYLLRLHDGRYVETVLIPANPALNGGRADRRTLCVSSQVGCAYDCKFCASGLAGFTRNLSVAEIVEQVVQVEQHSGERVDNLVFMGMGEPLANYRSVVDAVRRLVSPVPEGLGMSARGITISTVGLVPRIRQLAQEQLPVTLAISLHAPDDDLRDTLVPVNVRWPVQEVMDAAWEYATLTHRRVSIEYALIREINDQPWRAEALARLLQGRLAHVNLIPLNPTPGSAWTASSPQAEAAFVATLRRLGLAVTVRDTRGREIDGACGQLAALT
jgi:23S rRNA (adenine2503-C2)-methyltransferase